MLGADLSRTREQRSGASHTRDPRSAARRQRQPLHRTSQQLGRFLGAAQGLAAGTFARRLDALTNTLGWLTGAGLQLTRARTRNRDQQVEAVEQGPRELVPVSREPHC